MLSNQELGLLKNQIQQNKHEVFIISVEEFDDIITHHCSNMSSHSPEKKQKIKNMWLKVKNGVNYTASYTSLVIDLHQLKILITDLGALGAQVYYKSYNGKTHIILKGYSGLRKILNGTKYGVTNTKIVTMGLGRAGAISSVRSGGLISISLITSYRVINYFLTDQETLTQLFGNLASDIVKIGISTGASIAAAMMTGGFSLAIGPLVAVIFIGVGVSLALDQIDSQYGLTNKLIACLDEIGDDVDNYYKNKRKNVEQEIKSTINDITISVIDYAIEMAMEIAVRATTKFFQKFFNGRPQLF